MTATQRLKGTPYGSRQFSKHGSKTAFSKRSSDTTTGASFAGFTPLWMPRTRKRMKQKLSLPQSRKPTAANCGRLGICRSPQLGPLIKGGGGDPNKCGTRHCGRDCGLRTRKGEMGKCR